MINWFSSIGLLLDIIGVIMIFIYGLAPALKSVGKIIYEDMTEEEEKENKIITIKSRFGLFLIIVGFLLQLIGTNLSCLY